MARAKKQKAIVTPAAERYVETDDEESEAEKRQEVIVVRSDTEDKTSKKDEVSSDSSDSSDSGDDKEQNAPKESKKQPDLAIKYPTGSTKHRDDDLPETDDHGLTINSRDKDPLSASKPNPYDDETNED